MATWGGSGEVLATPPGVHAPTADGTDYGCAHRSFCNQLGRNHQAITPVWVHREPRNVTAAVLSGDAAARTSPNFY